MQSKETTGQNRTVTGLVGLQCEPWHRQPLVRGYMESSYSSCYQICICEAAGSPWCFQLDVYNSTCMYVVAVALYSEGPDSFALLGALAQDATLWGSGAEQHRR